MASDEFTNFSWSFNVDSGFDYQVRLNLRKVSADETNIPGVFQVSLTSQASARRAEIPASEVEIKDDAVPRLPPIRSENMQQKLQLTVRQSVTSNSSNDKVVLNGVEVFKVCGTNNNTGHDFESLLSYSASPAYVQSVSDAPSVYLSTSEAPSPARSTFSDPPVSPPSQSSSQKRISTTGSRSSSRHLPVPPPSLSSSLQRISTTGSPSSSRHGSSTLGSPYSPPYGLSTPGAQGLGTIIFGLEEIEKATNNFDRALHIGKGGFGDVYRGALFDGLTNVAIKRWNPVLSRQGMNEFRSEIENLWTIRHHNLVSLIGYCEGKGEMILVYDYMPQGTLRAHLYKDEQASLSWKTRLNICIGAARGLHYLHTSTQQGIIHRDVKPSNILLDENFEAKISDFGLARVGPDPSISYVSTEIKGSLAYLDPDYWKSGQLTKKSDVYSFGVVLLEVLSGRPPTDPLLSNQQPLSVARRYFKKGTLEPLTAPYLKSQIELRCLRKFSKIVIDCLSLNHNERPSMGTVLHDLEAALETQEKAQKLQATGSVLERHKFF